MKKMRRWVKDIYERFMELALLIKPLFSGKIRGRFAGVGMKYDTTLNEFVDPQPYPSWVYIKKQVCMGSTNT